MLSCLYNLGDGTIEDYKLTSEKDERSCALDHMEKLNCGDIIVFDRGYFSYLLLYESQKRGINIICRLQEGRMNKRIKAFWDSESADEVIEYYPSEAVKSELRKRGNCLDFKRISLSLIKYKIGKEIYVCATTLIGDKYLAKFFELIYHGRWGIEELYKISKQIIEVTDFHSQTERGVKQEIYPHLLLINIGRFLELILENGEIEPSLITANTDLQQKISKHPGLLWKTKNVKKFKDKRD